jgi:hypothetical protein
VNGTEREVCGTVQRNAGGYRVEVRTLDGPEQSILSPLTLMPCRRRELPGPAAPRWRANVGTSLATDDDGAADAPAVSVLVSRIRQLFQIPRG